MRRLWPTIITLLLLCALSYDAYAIASGLEGKSEPAWLIVKGDGRLLEIAQDNVVKLDGAGRLKFKREGRFIEVPKGCKVIVNGLPISAERAILKGESVQIIDPNRAPVWQLSLGSERSSSPSSDSWAEISVGNADGEFTLSHDRPMTTLLRATGGMLRIRSFPSLFSSGDRYEEEDYK
jgi:hypothetical protein